jgi:hypothetical protein
MEAAAAQPNVSQTTMLLGVEGGGCELSLSLPAGADWTGDGPAPDDLLLNVSIVSLGYSAQDQMWVEASAWRAFVEEFRQLERHRRGDATLRGMVEDEFRLRCFAFDRSGHVAAEGHMRRRSEVGGAPREQCLAFSFELEADRLAENLAQLDDLLRAG